MSKNDVFDIVDKFYSSDKILVNLAEDLIRFDREYKAKEYDFFLKMLNSQNVIMHSSYDDYLCSKSLLFTCNKCNTTFESNNRFLRVRNKSLMCPKCLKKYKETKDIINSDIVKFVKDLTCNNELYEYDNCVICLPNKKLAIEVICLYSHDSYANIDIYHNAKITQSFEGIQLLTFLDAEWLYKKDIVKAIIRSKLGIYDNVINADNCEVKKISNSDYIDFLNINHIQGAVPAKIRLGLIYNDELVSVIGIQKPKSYSMIHKILRFSSKLNTKVIGSLSKLMKYLKFEEYEAISDLRYFDIEEYEESKFKLLDRIEPECIYTNGRDILYHKDTKLLVKLC